MWISTDIAAQVHTADMHRVSEIAIFCALDNAEFVAINHYKSHH